ncbi:MAG TPA: flavodoxin [Streptosporangiaceae bacterium]|nr:flavodoxin [Streptosporangiaceae bacterium]
MRVVIVYESMFGNTRVVADAIAAGFGPGNDTVVIPVTEAGDGLLEGADLLVVGGPTHVHGLSRANTRKGAADVARKPGSRVTAEPGADGPGLREWFAAQRQHGMRAVAFDTRLEGPAVLTGRASKGITRLIREHGFTLLAPAESFLVTKDNALRAGEQERAREWGGKLAGKAATVMAS